MGLFDNMLKDSESLFNNEMALDFDYMPHIIKYRENQQGYIATCIKPLFQDRNGKNLLISGKPGIGKTIATRFVLQELEKETNNIIPIYINCWKKDTLYKIMLSICEQVNYKWVHNKKSDELFKEACKLLNKKKVVFCFDEIDKLKEVDALYAILEEVYKKTIIIITNEKEWLAKLDPRIRSRLIPEILEFEPYNYDETKGIIEQRVEYAFVDGVWSEEALQKIIEKTAELGDVRAGLFILREAGYAAENESKRKIEEKHADKAIEKLESFKIRDSKDIENEEKEVLGIIKENEGKDTKELYNKYKEKTNKTRRTFQRKIKDLKKAGLITIEEEGADTGFKVKVSSASKKLTEY